MRRMSVVVGAATLAVSISTYAASTVDPQVGALLHLSKRQVKPLLKAAHSAEDFRLLSRYYDQESQRLERRAREHEQEAAGYASRRVFEPKTSIPGGLLAHCRYFAWYYQESANQAKALAAHYEKLAESADNLKHSQPRKVN